MLGILTIANFNYLGKSVGGDRKQSLDKSAFLLLGATLLACKLVLVLVGLVTYLLIDWKEK